MSKDKGKITKKEEYKYIEFGIRLKEVMFRQNISNRELAQKMFVTPSTISDYRNGRRAPSIDNLAALSRILHVSADYLIGVSNEP